MACLIRIIWIWPFLMKNERMGAFLVQFLAFFVHFWPDRSTAAFREKRDGWDKYIFGQEMACLIRIIWIWPFLMKNERMGAFLVQFLAIFVHSGLPLWIMEAVDRD